MVLLKLLNTYDTMKLVKFIFLNYTVIYVNFTLDKS